MKLIIAGGRGFTDYDLLKFKVSHITNRLNIDNIICGGARGADSLGEKYALENGIDVIHLIPDWEKHGKSAGYRRNYEMALVGTHLIAFWDGKSKGTKNMIDTMKKMNKPVRVIYYECK